MNNPNELLKNQILEAIVRRTSIILSQLEDLSFRKFKNFNWIVNEDSILMAINFNDEEVLLNWNGETDDDKIEVQSNIERTIDLDLPWFVELENLVFSELTEIEKTLPPKLITVQQDEEDFEKEFDDE